MPDLLRRRYAGAERLQDPSFTTTDLSFSWQAVERWQIFGSVQNLFDRIAPLDPTTYGAINFNPLHFSGAMGRYYTLGAKYAFE